MKEELIEVAKELPLKGIAKALITYHIVLVIVALIIFF